jgi:hypothetical protein
MNSIEGRLAEGGGSCVRVDAEPVPELDLVAEGCHELRWVSADEAAALSTRPEDLAERLKRLQPG